MVFLGGAFAADELVLGQPFEQLDELLPTPNAYRTASGAPGHEYWQQQVDYVIDVTLDDERRHLTGHETIVYHNNSPDTLTYLWVQLDPNIFSPVSHSAASSEASCLGTKASSPPDVWASHRTVRSASGIPGSHPVTGSMPSNFA